MQAMIIAVFVCLAVGSVLLTGSWALAMAGVGSPIWLWYWIMSAVLFIPGLSMFISFVIGLARIQTQAENELERRIKELKESTSQLPVGNPVDRLSVVGRPVFTDPEVGHGKGPQR